MWENMKFKSQRGSGSYLAAYFVFSIGMVACTAFALVAFNDHPEIAWFVLGGFFVLALLSLRAWRVELPSMSLKGIFGRRRRELYEEYVPRRRYPRSLEYGTNHPPTVEDIREARNSTSNWVPHGAISGGRPRSRRSEHPPR